MADVFKKILDDAYKKGIIVSKEAEARTWLREKAQSVRVRNPQRVIDVSENKVQSISKTGLLHYFSYDAKTKDTLPYYDKFPIVFPFRITREGFYGINMHYLPPQMRAVLMDNLYSLATTEKIDDTTRLKLSYSVLERVSKFRYFKPCVKHYLNSHITSRLVFVPAEQWDIALFLPLAKFQGATSQKVYSDSRKRIQRGK